MCVCAPVQIYSHSCLTVELFSLMASGLLPKKFNEREREREGGIERECV